MKQIVNINPRRLDETYKGEKVINFFKDICRISVSIDDDLKYREIPVPEWIYVLNDANEIPTQKSNPGLFDLLEHEIKFDTEEEKAIVYRNVTLLFLTDEADVRFRKNHPDVIQAKEGFTVNNP